MRVNAIYASVTFKTLEGPSFDVPVQPEKAAAIGRYLAAGRPSLMEQWLVGELFEGDLTEVLIDASLESVAFYLVISSHGVLNRIAVRNADAVLTGLQMDLPFFVVGYQHNKETHANLSEENDPAELLKISLFANGDPA